MPDPFRHYEDVVVLDLPADPPPPGVAVAGALDGSGFLSQLFFYSAAISASKIVPATGYRYALRVNPSSGNLHPTEFHFCTRGLLDWPDGFYHYRPSSHMAEQRALGDMRTRLPDLSAPITLVLTSIAWREAWKYRARAYRYCLLDIGHAWQSLAVAAEAMGCEVHAAGEFPDADLSALVNDDEWPMLIVTLRGRSIPVRAPDIAEVTWFGGAANQLSPTSVAYPLLDDIHAASSVICSSLSPFEPARTGAGEIRLPPPAPFTRAFVEVARTRRSALDFRADGPGMSLSQLSAILTSGVQHAIYLQLYLYVHRVEGLSRGVYRHWPERGELELVRSGDQRVAAAGLSLGQDLAGNACVAFSMVADLERATRAYGDRGYRYAYFEAGAIGQRLYLAAEALGLRATGIGAFFDEKVHRYLEITPEQGQVIYHFAIGHAVVDPRLEA